MHVFNKPTPAPRPEISPPIPGSGRRFAKNSDGSVPPNPLPGASTAMPHNEYPRNRPVPNSIMLPKTGGGFELIKLPPGSALSKPMPQAHARTDEVDIHSLGWPRNNRDTNRLRDLKEEHKTALKDLDAARLRQPYLSAEEKKTLPPDQIRIRKQEIAAGRKASKEEIHGLEKAERQARRNMEVFQGRFSKELRTEANYRESAASTSAHGSLFLPADAALPATPTRNRSASAPAPFGRSQAPNLETIREQTPTPPILDMPPGASLYHGLMESASSLGPVERKHESLKQGLRTAKNAYHGMKPESALHSRDAMATARTRYKEAESDLAAFRKQNKFSLRLEAQGTPLPDIDELRRMLHPRTNDMYPFFPGAASASVSPETSRGPSGMHTPLEAPLRPFASSDMPALPDGPILRPSAPGPDHPRNIASQSAPRQDQFGLDYFGI